MTAEKMEMKIRYISEISRYSSRNEEKFSEGANEM